MQKDYHNPHVGQMRTAEKIVFYRFKTMRLFSANGYNLISFALSLTHFNKATWILNDKDI